MQDETKPKPCPFCDSEAECKEVTHQPVWWVQCMDCKAGTKYHSTRAAAIAAWNTRAEPAEAALAQRKESDD